MAKKTYAFLGYIAWAIDVDGRYRNLVLGVRAINNQLSVVIKMDAAPDTISIIPVYAPTSTASEEEINKFYSTSEDTH